MSKIRELRQRCNEFQKTRMWNSLNVCEECNNVNICSINVQRINMKQEEIECNKMSNFDASQNNCGRRSRVHATKIKGKIEEV